VFVQLGLLSIFLRALQYHFISKFLFRAKTLYFLFFLVNEVFVCCESVLLLGYKF